MMPPNTAGTRPDATQLAELDAFVLDLLKTTDAWENDSVWKAVEAWKPFTFIDTDAVAAATKARDALTPQPPTP